MVTISRLKELEQCSPGEQVMFTAYLANMKKQFTKDNTEYTRLYFRDSQDSMSVPIWDTRFDTAKEMYKLDTVLSIVASTRSYNNATVVDRILSCKAVTDEKVIRELTKQLYREATPFCIDLVRRAVNSLVGTMYEPYIMAIYGESNDSPEFTQLMKSYASINHHDNYPGGLLNHVGGMLLLEAETKKNYLSGRCENAWDVDWQYITAGILMHDIGKLQTYNKVSEFVVEFREDCTLDHNTIGVGMLYGIHNSIARDKRMSEADFQKLAYTICYHDSSDKLYTHKRNEDKIISYIDGLESTLAISVSVKSEEDKNVG